MYNMQPFIHKIYFPSLFTSFLILFKKTAPIRHAISSVIGNAHQISENPIAQLNPSSTQHK